MTLNGMCVFFESRHHCFFVNLHYGHNVASACGPFSSSRTWRKYMNSNSQNCWIATFIYLFDELINKKLITFKDSAFCCQSFVRFHELLTRFCTFRVKYTLFSHEAGHQNEEKTFILKRPFPCFKIEATRIVQHCHDVGISRHCSPRSALSARSSIFGAVTPAAGRHQVWDGQILSRLKDFWRLTVCGKSNQAVAHCPSKEKATESTIVRLTITVTSKWEMFCIGNKKEKVIVKCCYHASVCVCVCPTHTLQPKIQEGINVNWYQLTRIRKDKLAWAS